jgi:tungstate transport system permease protein
LEELRQALIKAFELIGTLDPDVVEATRRSLAISATSSSLAVVMAVPLGSLIHFNRFRGKRWLISVIQTLYSLPTVVVGLLVFVIFSRAGVLGDLGLIFTPAAIVIGEVVLIMPLMIGLVISALSGVDKAIPETAISLGAGRLQIALITLREARFAVLAAIIVGFGRAISEVGLALMVGGNIRGFTRTLTTAISLQTSRGDIELALALGIVLLIIALGINIALNRMQQR